MPVLARRLNESIVIAEEVRVTVLKTTPNRIELGIDAGSHVSLDREEVHLLGLYVDIREWGAKGHGSRALRRKLTLGTRCQCSCSSQRHPLGLRGPAACRILH
jgi:carbon storage regulator CsrA